MGNAMIIWTKHALEKQGEWEKKKLITRQDVESVIKNPQQIVQGDFNILVAQSKMFNGLLRIPFKSMGEDKKILTLYWTSKVEKYWRT
jgi:hypothetical protein